VDANVNSGLCFEKGRGVPLDRAEAERLYQLAPRSGYVLALTSVSIATLDVAIACAPHDGTTPTVALARLRDAV
jgi:TPR repeat protein